MRILEDTPSPMELDMASLSPHILAQTCVRGKQSTAMLAGSVVRLVMLLRELR